MDDCTHREELLIAGFVFDAAGGSFDLTDPFSSAVIETGTIACAACGEILAYEKASADALHSGLSSI